MGKLITCREEEKRRKCKYTKGGIKKKKEWASGRVKTGRGRRRDDGSHSPLSVTGRRWRRPPKPINPAPLLPPALPPPSSTHCHPVIQRRRWSLGIKSNRPRKGPGVRHGGALVKAADEILRQNCKWHLCGKHEGKKKLFMLYGAAAATAGGSERGVKWVWGATR